MHRYERWLIIGLVALVVLIVALVIVGPLIRQPTSSSEPALAPGQTETMTARHSRLD